jgi:hypothetical protein
MSAASAEWHDALVDDDRFVNVRRPAGGGPYACPCCGYITLDERAGYELSPCASGRTTGKTTTTPTEYAAVRTGS